MSVTILPIAAAFLASAASSADNAYFRYNTSELATTASAQQLYHRLEANAERACADKDRASQTRIKALIRKCEAGLMEDWIAKIDDPRLYKIHAAAKDQRDYASR